MNDSEFLRKDLYFPIGTNFTDSIILENLKICHCLHLFLFIYFLQLCLLYMVHFILLVEIILLIVIYLIYILILLYACSFKDSHHTDQKYSFR